MRNRLRAFIIIVSLMLGVVYLPAQAFLSSDNQNIWPVISQHFTIPTNPDQIDIRRQIDHDLRHPKYIRMLTRNARPFLYYVFQETKKKHMPAELALLPMIESEYTPSGESRTGAAGLWQLEPGTAYDLGVKMNPWYDGRRSTVASTKVALSFLSYLYQMFNHNWLLALAAYNAGPGTVQAAIHYNQAHGKPTNFWALHLPAQTEAYVPKLLALAEIIQHPKSYGVHLAPVPNKPLTSTVKLKKQMPLKTIAHMANTTVTTVKKLNPALKRSVTPPHQVVTLVLPTSNKTTFVKTLTVQKAINQEIAQHHLAHYTVQKGDSLSGIAQKYKTTVAELEKINQLHSELIRLNQAILVPQLIVDIGNTIVAHEKAKTVAITAAKKATKTAAATTTKAVMAKHKPQKPILLASAKLHHTPVATHHTNTYTVRPGDSLRVIARRHHTTIAALMHKNHLRGVRLQIGQHLVV